MKLEKISDNQIRCTLTKEDLESRHIRLSELAYGSDKAKKLFQDMMQEAGSRFGFHADNIPLMIEAIPVSEESITLIITKVEDPEELDTRFAKFAPRKKGEDKSKPIEDADDVLNLIRKLYEMRKKAQNTESAANTQENTEKAPLPKERPVPSRGTESTGAVDFVRLYHFRDLDTVIDAAAALGGTYQGFNTLYRIEPDGTYALTLHKSAHTPEEFNRVCNILAEYGRNEACTPAGEAHLAEHARLIEKGNALQKLSALTLA